MLGTLRNRFTARARDSLMGFLQLKKVSTMTCSNISSPHATAIVSIPACMADSADSTSACRKLGTLLDSPRISISPHLARPHGLGNLLVAIALAFPR